MKNSNTQWYLILLVFMIYALLFIFRPEKGDEALKNSLELLGRILPILLLVMALMVIFNYFLSDKVIEDHISRNSGIREWIIAIIGGLISIGPIYIWYPLVRRLMEEGVSPGPIAAFLYARSIKIQFLPLMVIYFGMEYVGVLTVVMILASVVIGIIMEIIMGLFYQSYS